MTKSKFVVFALALSLTVIVSACGRGSDTVVNPVVGTSTAGATCLQWYMGNCVQYSTTVNSGTLAQYCAAQYGSMQSANTCVLPFTNTLVFPVNSGQTVTFTGSGTWSASANLSNCDYSVTDGTHGFTVALPSGTQSYVGTTFSGAMTASGFVKFDLLDRFNHVNSRNCNVSATVTIQ